MENMSLPQQFKENMAQWLKADAQAYFAQIDQPPYRGLRQNTLKPGRDLPARLADWAAVPWCAEGKYIPAGERPGKWPEHAAGMFYIQEPSAMAPAAPLNVRPGMRVLDLCAAPGGKTSQLAMAMAGQGVLVANEIHSGRARILLENIERMGIENAIVLNETPQRLATHFAGWFDAILVDAPCSGEGMFRREAEAMGQWSPEAVESCHLRQVEILNAAATMLRAGGRLVYSTCTFNPIENEKTVERFLAENRQFALDGELRRIMPPFDRGEGQFFCAFSCREGKDEQPRAQMEPVAPPPVFSAFADACLCLDEEPLVFEQGQWLYTLPKGTPSLKGLRVLRVGVQLGKLLPKRFEPAHAFALKGGKMLWRQRHALAPDEALLYLRGHELRGEMAGWGIVTVDGNGLGLVKGSGGVLKNHYPKGLRWN